MCQANGGSPGYSGTPSRKDMVRGTRMAVRGSTWSYPRGIRRCRCSMGVLAAVGAGSAAAPAAARPAAITARRAIRLAPTGSRLRVVSTCTPVCWVSVLRRGGACITDRHSDYGTWRSCCDGWARVRSVSSSCVAGQLQLFDGYGEPDVDAVYEACTRLEAAVHRPVNPTILSLEEFAAPSGFLDNVRSGPALAVIG